MCSGRFCLAFERAAHSRLSRRFCAPTPPPPGASVFPPTAQSLCFQVSFLPWHCWAPVRLSEPGGCPAADGWKFSLKSVHSWWITPSTWPQLHTRLQAESESHQPEKPCRGSMVRTPFFKVFWGSRWPRRESSRLMKKPRGQKPHRVGRNTVNWWGCGRGRPACCVCLSEFYSFTKMTKGFQVSRRREISLSQPQNIDSPGGDHHILLSLAFPLPLICFSRKTLQRTSNSAWNSPWVL